MTDCRNCYRKCHDDSLLIFGDDGFAFFLCRRCAKDLRELLRRPALLEPVDGDEIDELVNWQIAKGKDDWWK